VSRQVVFRPEAEDEVLEVREWYETRRPGLGSEFAQAVDAIVGSIVENPLLYQRAHKRLDGQCCLDSLTPSIIGFLAMKSLCRRCTAASIRHAG
jgi:hypothetical protein